MQKRDKQILGVIAAVILISIITLLYYSFSDGQRKFAEQISLDESIKGTSIEKVVLEIKDSVDSGRSPVTMAKVLEEKDGYICAIKAVEGLMSLKVKDGMIREDILWGKANTTAFIIGSNVYRYSLQYRQWLKFDYSPEMEMSNRQITHGIYSEYELINKTMPENVVCVRADVPESDFEFPIEEAVDVEEAISDLNIG